MTQARLRHLLLLTASGIIASSLAAPAWAQSSAPATASADAESQTEVADIIVTATKRGDEALRNVPIAIQA